ncbi:SPOR domain-containing protein [Flavobacterium sp. NKUCC04_CG]|uniref:SPOR domain-containing protein n=1 Tax=Flavobacterium sp. NKUCC04_CG TaxID=2842121 RepID=UPI001C5AFDC9|nr:SPOR domain-containing protein [Flavobacterium sp. NKUCC04_CG]MBW3518243.1 SPOR domain-containing protein [Flavobacterium sp. NKUCC04_CG]
MRILRNLLATTYLICCANVCFAQQQKVTIQEDPSFQTLLNEKRKVNSSTTVNDRFKIQIFYGSNSEARNRLSQFNQQYSQLDGSIVYTNPSYKVWVGNFNTRIEAERNLQAIKSSFPNALIIRPNK